MDGFSDNGEIFKSRDQMSRVIYFLKTGPWEVDNVSDSAQDMRREISSAISSLFLLEYTVY